jgi:hypothetical protein
MNKILRSLLVLVLLFVVPSLALAAGSSMTFTYDNGVDGDGNANQTIRKITCDWVSDDATGAASATTKKIVGRLIKVVTDPGSPAPTANYDVVVTDENSLNPLAACTNAAALLARHTTTTEATELSGGVSDTNYFAVCDALTIAVANAGNSKQGRIVFYYAPK